MIFEAVSLDTFNNDAHVIQTLTIASSSPHVAMQIIRPHLLLTNAADLQSN